MENFRFTREIIIFHREETEFRTSSMEIQISNDNSRVPLIGMNEIGAHTLACEIDNRQFALLSIRNNFVN